MEPAVTDAHLPFAPAADGCFYKGENPEEVAQAIRDALDGLIYFSEEMVRAD